MLSPKLTAAQFDTDGISEISCTAAGRQVRVRYENPQKLDWGEYRVDGASTGNRRWAARNGAVVIPKEDFPETGGVWEITVALTPCEGGEKNV